MPTNPVQDLLRKLPATPGVYQFFDAAGELLYIGKAKVLKNRVKSYFQTGDHAPRTAKLVEKIADLKWLETATEAEALALEANLVKEHQPKFNVLLRDDKSFLYFKVTVQEEFPRVFTTRRVVRDGAKYFGPQTDATAVQNTLKLLQKLFQLRVCNLEMTEAASGQVTVTRAPTAYPCIYKQIRLCTAPCDSSTTRAAYAEQVRAALAFLAGDTSQVLKDLNSQMQAAAANRNFELAARLRDNVQALQALAEKQRVTDPDLASRDILGIKLENTRAYLALLTVRGGKLLDQKNFTLSTAEADADEVLTAFLTQFYSLSEDLPREILLPVELPESAALAEFLAARAGRKVALLVPERGKKSGLLSLAEKNAAAYAVQQKARFENASARTVGAAADLAAALNLTSKLKRIECYDISHLSGTATTGSMVVFRDGEPANAAYRQFKIRTLGSGEVDDYKSLAEVLRRRMWYLLPQLPAGVMLRRANKKDAMALEAVRLRKKETGEICDDLREWWVAEAAGAIVARVKLRLLAEPKIWVFYHLFVAEAWRGHRLGQALIRTVLAKLKPPKVYLSCVNNLIDYYAELGFQPVRQVPTVLEENLRKFCARHPEKPPFTERSFLVWNARTQQSDPSFAEVPDLVVLDGGKGQLSAVLGAVQFPKKTAVVGLAKRAEEIWRIKQKSKNNCHPERRQSSVSETAAVEGSRAIGTRFANKVAASRGPSTPPAAAGSAQDDNNSVFEKIVLPEHSNALHLITRIRDEAHRTANDLRKTILKKSTLTTSLDEIAGLGPAARKKLLQKFGSPAAVKTANLTDLTAVAGQALAEKIVKWAEE